MAQVTSGVRAILSNPRVYDVAQFLMGGAANRRWMQRDFIRARAGDAVLDVGCGTADILSVMPPVNYIGFDISSSYIDRARARWGDRGAFFAELLDERRIRTLPRFDLILATGLLHHLDDDEARALFGALSVGLKPGGRIITVDGCFVDGQNPLAKFVISQDRGQNVRRPEAYRDLACDAFEVVHGDVVSRAWIPYTYWIMQLSAPKMSGARGAVP